VVPGPSESGTRRGQAGPSGRQRSSLTDVDLHVSPPARHVGPCRRSRPAAPEQLPYPFRITVAENASTDSTVAVATRVADERSWVAENYTSQTIDGVTMYDLGRPTG
jgi:hypothetical protein